MIVNVGRHDFTTHYLCTECDTKIPKFTKYGRTVSNVCPNCHQIMRAKAHNPKHKRQLELMGLIKRY